MTSVLLYSKIVISLKKLAVNQTFGYHSLQMNVIYIPKFNNMDIQCFFNVLFNLNLTFKNVSCKINL